MDTANFLFPVSLIDIFVSNLFTSIIPFYAFYYALTWVWQKPTRLKGSILFVLIIVVKFLIEYYGYQHFQNLLYGTHNTYTPGYMLGLSLSGDIKVLIFSAAFYFLSRSKSAEDKLLVIQNEKLEAEQKKLQAEMAYLKAQINPHFLHNVLNFFYAQALPLSPRLAESILSLSEIMRYALNNNEDEKGRVWVNKEIEFVTKIIHMNQLRFNGNLFAVLKHTGDDISRLQIIPMILITLVENAFKHGSIHDPRCPVTITADYNAGENLFSFTVFNHIKKGPKELSHGIGLENARSRLAMEYGDNARLNIIKDAATHEVKLTIKF
jgi:two-component system, LytTR family, sensor kinase